jgi:7,8-dihydroneopterin aldolase/epimerase/oxygenase
MSSFIIQLHHLRLFGHHGLYGEEATVGNEFEVNLTMEANAPDETRVSIKDTINYAAVYQIVRDVFRNREELLETIAMKIAEATKEEFPLLKKIAVQIIKLHPPITAFTGAVSVTYNKEYEH